MTHQLTKNPLLQQIKQRAEAYREHSLANSIEDAADRAYLLDLLDLKEKELADLRAAKETTK